MVCLVFEDKIGGRYFFWVCPESKVSLHYQATLFINFVVWNYRIFQCYLPIAAVSDTVACLTFQLIRKTFISSFCGRPSTHAKICLICLQMWCKNLVLKKYLLNKPTRRNRPRTQEFSTRAGGPLDYCIVLVWNLKSSPTGFAEHFFGKSSGRRREKFLKNVNNRAKEPIPYHGERAASWLYL